MQQTAFTVSTVLDHCLSVSGLPSDYALSKRLNCPASTISNWRAGRSLPDEKRCLQLAEIGGMDADLLAVKFNALRAQSEEGRTLWNRVAKRLAASLHIFLVAVFFSLTAPAENANASTTYPHPAPLFGEAGIGLM